MPTTAGASHWEKIPRANRTQAESEWKSKALGTMRGLRSTCTDSAPCHVYFTDFPGLCLLFLCTQTSRPLMRITTVRFGWTRKLKLECSLQVPGPNQRQSDSRVLRGDAHICILNRNHRWLQWWWTNPYTYEELLCTICYIHVRNRLTSKHIN